MARRATKPALEPTTERPDLTVRDLLPGRPRWRHAWDHVTDSPLDVPLDVDVRDDDFHVEEVQRLARRLCYLDEDGVIVRLKADGALCKRVDRLRSPKVNVQAVADYLYWGPVLQGRGQLAGRPHERIRPPAHGRLTTHKSRKPPRPSSWWLSSAR